MSEIVFGGGVARRTVPTYERGRLRPGNRLPAPAVVHEMDSTVVLSPGWAGEVLENGTIRLIQENGSP